MSSDNVQALPPGTRLGDYRLDAVIGHGGFGITYRAFDTQLAKIVAIKEYLPVEFALRSPDGEVKPRGARYGEDFAWGRERFLDEARALARFRHPHIVPVLRYFEAHGTAYTVMEFEDGRSVGDLLRDGRGMAPDEVRRLATGLLEGLGAVHAQGFLHRDIKPSNIIVRRDGVPVLIDFGAARQAMGERTRTLTGIITPQYAPIEQYALDGRQGPWSDIYAAAAVLHHAIAGRPPPDAAARAGSDGYRPLAAAYADRFEPALLQAVDRALAFAPADRPQSVGDWAKLFGVTLSRVQDAPTHRLTRQAMRLGGATRPSEEAATAPPPSPGSGRRRPTALAIAAIVIVVGGAALWLRSQPETPAEASTTPVEVPAPQDSAAAPAQPQQPAPPAQQPAPPAQQPAPPAQQPATPAAPQPPRANTALVDQAERAALSARAVLEKADEAARAARAMAGEARIVAARAGSPDLANASRLSYEGGASYVGQVTDGKRQGLGVAELASGERQAGEWSADRLNGLGTVRLADDTRYSGQWRDGQSTGLGVREKPGVERAEGTFKAGSLEGPGVRRALGDAAIVQSGEFHGDQLDGPGVETAKGQRYEGSFRAGRRNGYGQLTEADGKVTSGRWQDGKLVETAP
ncbi:MAG: protein kinase domain-containing protein [Pseudomonadota bacterium]